MSPVIGIRNRVIGLLDSATDLGLKAGIPLVIIATAYLVYTAFGHHVREIANMNENDRAYFLNCVDMVIKVFVIAGTVVVASFVIRFFNAEPTGQGLSIAGAALYFGSAFFLGLSVASFDVQGKAVIAKEVAAFRYLGAVALVPGLILLLRDAILRIWMGVSVRRLMERRWGDEEERRKGHKAKTIYGMCWDMPYCRDFVKKICPAFKERKPCWRKKTGCYCDEKTILLAMTGGQILNSHVKGILHSLGLDQAKNRLMSSAQKRARCRRCVIYAEHQRQKYRLLSPMVFPAVGLVLYMNYATLSGWITTVFEQTDKFMKFLTYKPGEMVSTFSMTDSQLLIGMGMAWIAIVAVSYTLRLLEYFVFDLQV